jgi:DNA polymerase elongation subunit (family B)
MNNVYLDSETRKDQKKKRLILEELNLSILRLLKNEWSRGRVIALDIETSVVDPDNFLTNERILAISFARRVSGQFMESRGILVKTIFLDDDDDESEKRLLENLDKELSDVKPLGVVGFGVRFYDIPLLVIKRRYHKLLLWKLIDLAESTAIIDLYHILKYRRYKNLEEVLSAQEFKHLPLKRTRHLVSTNRDEKGKDIYGLWKEDRETLRKYSEGEVHDFLLIAEYLAFGGGYREH